MPAIIPIVVALAASGGTIAAAKMSSDAAEHAVDVSTQATNHAADLQSASAQKALDFSKTQAEADARNQEIARKANYDQWAAQEARKSTFGQMLGLPARNTPAYVPSQDPNYLGTATPNVSPTISGAMPTQQGPAQTAVPGGDYKSWFESLTGGKPLDQNGLLALKPQLDAAGVKITPPSQAGVVSKIGLPDGSWVRVLNGDTKVASPTVWIPQPGSGGTATAFQAPGVASSPAYMPLPQSPLLQAPTLSGMLR